MQGTKLENVRDVHGIIVTGVVVSVGINCYVLENEKGRYLIHKETVDKKSKRRKKRFGTTFYCYKFDLKEAQKRMVDPNDVARRGEYYANCHC